MNNNKLYSYSIMNLDTNHIDEICEDIKNQYETGVASCALFSMTLVPEGNPPADKASLLCGKYLKFKEKLDSMNIPSGVLVQATIGHGWVLSEMFPYQRYVNFTDGEPTHTVCPYDDGFGEYIYNALRAVAKTNPDTIMIDDDLRLMYRLGEGCACPLHMKRFNELAHTSLTREELRDFVVGESETGKKYKDIYVETQKESVLKVARLIRDAIDSVNPSIPGSYCCDGPEAEFAAEIAEIVAGEGNPKMVRINNGNYTAAGPRYFSNAFSRAANQIAKLKDKVDVILAETDTCPQNRYSTSAMFLHTHFTGTILEGARGAKHWITRLAAYEPESGKAYRRILGKYSGFYNTLASIVPTLRRRGLRIPVSSVADFKFGRGFDVSADGVSEWSRCVLERFGLPMYFSAQNGGVLCLEGECDTAICDEELKKAFEGTVFVSSDSAERLIKRGFGKYLGVDVREWDGKQPTGEILHVNGNTCNRQMQIKELVPLSDDVRIDSTVYHSVDKVNFDHLFPGTTVFKNELGGTSVVFCGTPKAKFNLVEAFSFLNYSRKQQFIRLMNESGEMPVYYPNDEEMYFCAADMPGGKLLCALFNIGFDPIEKTELVFGSDIKSAYKLMPDGSMNEVKTEKADENGKYVFDTCCNPVEPLILIVETV